MKISVRATLEPESSSSLSKPLEQMHAAVVVQPPAVFVVSVSQTSFSSQLLQGLEMKFFVI